MYHKDFLLCKVKSQTFKSFLDILFDVYEGVNVMVGIKKNGNDIKYEIYFKTSWKVWYERHLILFPENWFQTPKQLHNITVISIDLDENDESWTKLEHVNVYSTKGGVSEEYTCFPNGTKTLRGITALNVQRVQITSDYRKRPSNKLYEVCNKIGLTNEEIVAVHNFYNNKNYIFANYNSQQVEITNKGDFIGLYITYVEIPSMQKFLGLFDYGEELKNFAPKMTTGKWSEIGIYISKSDLNSMRPIRTAFYA